MFVEFAGGKGLWAAERLGPDDVRVSYPGYIGDCPGPPAHEECGRGTDNEPDQGGHRDLQPR